MKKCICVLCGIWSAVFLLGPVASAPYPSVPGELLVQVRIPTIARNKSGASAYDLPPLIRKGLESEGLVSAQPLTNPSGGKKALGVGGAGSQGVFLLKFNSKEPVEDLVAKAESLPGIALAEPNYVGALCAAPHDEFYFSNQKATFDRMGFEEAWEYSTGSPDTIIAVLDSGVDTTHPDFAGRLLPGYNFLNDSTDVFDPLGHGTRVAGILGARGDDTGQESGMSGICWDCRLLPVVVAGVDQRVNVADLIEAINYSVDQGADVINMSLAIGGDSKLLENACNAAAKQAILVAAAGNQGQNYVPLFPAGYESVIGVGSLDSEGNRSDFSNYNLPGVNEFVDFAAPGEGIFTTIPAWLYDAERTNGTSFAAPFVAGVVALLRSLYPEQSPGAIRAHLERHGQSVGNIVSKGLLDAGGALSTPLEPMLRVASVTIRDGTDLNPANDADFALDGGETAEIVVDLENGGADFPSFPATLLSSDSHIAVVTSTVSFPALGNSASRKNLAAPFAVEVAAGAPQSTSMLRLSIPGLPEVEFEVMVENEAPVPQSITSDLTFGLNHTWIVSGLTTVATGATLTAEPGTTVKFDGGARLEIWGGLSSEGTIEDRIRWENKTPPPVSLFAPARGLPVGWYPFNVIATDVTGDGILDLVTANGWSNDVSVLAGDGGGGFFPQQRYPVGNGPAGLVAVDVSGDGVLDLVTSNYFSHDVSVLVGDGAGGFVPQDRYPLSDQPDEWLIVADVTADGILDLTTLNYGKFNKYVSVLAGDGAGKFLPQVRYQVGDKPEKLIAADVTGDGFLDLVTSNRFSHDVSVLTGNGVGGFFPDVRYAVGLYPNDLIVEDVTGDGFLDVVTTNTESMDVSVLAGDGKGGFLQGIQFPVGVSPTSVSAADETGDGVLDLVIANSSPDISLLAGDGAGGFMPQVKFPLGDSPRGLIPVDVTGDGTPDLVTMYNSTDDAGGVSVLVGNGGGGFFPEIRFPVGGFPEDLIPADVTGDGILDLVMTDKQGEELLVLAGGEGEGRFSSEIRLAAGGGPTSLFAEDVTGDGIIDLVAANGGVYDTNCFCYVDSSVVVWEGDGAGGFLPQMPIMVGEFPTEVVAADATGDGVLDLLTFNRGNYSQVCRCYLGGTVSLLSGNGMGGFLPQLLYPIADGLTTFIAADVTGDEVLDLVTANQDYPESSLIVLAGNGVGGFLPQVRYPVGYKPEKIIALDVTGDGVLDLVTANQWSHDVSVLAGDGAGEFFPQARLPVANGPADIIAVDVTGDNVLDLVTRHLPGGSDYQGDLTVLEGDGVGGFLPGVRYDLGGEPSALIATDVTGDGVVDLVTAHFYRGEVCVLAGDGADGFVLPVRFPVGDGPVKVIAVDVNGDGVPDLATSNRGSNDVSVLIGDGLGGFLPQLRFPVGESPLNLIVTDVGGDGILDLVTSNLYSNDVSVLMGDGAGGFGAALTILGRPGSAITLSNSDLSLTGHASVQGTGTVTNCCFFAGGGSGLAVTGEVIVRDSTAENCVTGFTISSSAPPPNGLTAIRNRDLGILVQDATGCVASNNFGSGILSSGNLSDCHSDLNAGIGLYATNRIQRSTATRSADNGIHARVVTDSLAATNSGVGIVASEHVSRSIAIGNGQGIQAPIIENSQVIGTFGSALAGEGVVNDSAILENASIASDTIQFNNTILAGNAESATLDQIDGMYIAGNAGGGVRGIPVSNSTIIGNKGPGVDQNVSVTDSNVVFNEGPGVVGGTVSGSYVEGNRGGDLTAGAAGTLANSPVGSAPAFLANVQINLATITLEPTQTLGVGRAEFFLNYSKDMDTTRRLWVTFGQSSPFTSFIVAASPGWTGLRTWKGYYDIGGEVGSGTHTLRVSGARALPDALFPGGFEIPPDTYHRFTVDSDGGLALNNGRIVARTETSLTLAWDPSLDVDPLGFSIVRKEGGGPYRTVGFVQAGSTEFINSGLAPGTTYSYQVYESVSPNSYRELTRPVVGNPGQPFTPTPTPSATSTPTKSPIPTPTSTPCSPFDLSPDCHIDAEDLISLVEQIRSNPNAHAQLFGFAQSWMSSSP